LSFNGDFFMSAITLKAAGSLLASAGVASAAMAMVPGVALAATDCGTGTEVSTGICEKAFTTAGDYTFTAPSGVTKVSAIIVGAGGGAADFGGGGAYGGGGGEVVFVDSVDSSSTISATVGAGGAIAADPVPGVTGGDSSLGSTVASGGIGASFSQGGDSGSGEIGSTDGYHGAGGGAVGAAFECTGGEGVTASVVASGSALFPELIGEAVYGTGGSCTGLAPGAFTLTAGSGGSVSGDPVVADAGEDGAVIVRWGALPDTGLNVQPWMIGTGVATVAAGAIFASGLLRTRRQGRHSA
jgi:hypothetical protein